MRSFNRNWHSVPGLEQMGRLLVIIVLIFSAEAVFAQSPPLIVAQNPVSTGEETARAIAFADLVVIDLDSTYPLGFTLTVQDGLNYNRIGNTITPEIDFNGVLTVPVSVNDGLFESNVFNLSVTVTAINDPPVITGQGAVSTPEFTARPIVFADLTVTDPDNTYPVGFTLSVADGANYTRIGNTITPIANFNGDLSVPVVVNDGTDDSASFNMTVTVTPVNNVPVITGQNPLTTPEETALPIELTDLVVTDDDNIYPADFTLAVQDGTNYTRSGNTITPALDFNGNLTVPVTVSDGAANSLPFNLTVSVTAVNDQPLINGQNPVTTPEVTPLLIQLTDLNVTDPDNIFPAQFTLSVADGTNYTRVGNTITPDVNFNGDLNVPVVVIDNSGEANATSNPFSLTVTVTAVNDVPVITGQGTLSTPEENALAIALGDLSVTDPDNDYPADFTLAVQNGTNYTRAGNTITPAADFNGDLTVPVVVNDGTDNSAPFNLTVSVTPVNDRPILAGQDVLSTPEDTPITVLLSNLNIVDPDSVSFTFTLAAGDNYTLVGNTVTPAADFNGNLIIGATVTDDSGAANATSTPVDLTLAVDAVNDVPMVVTPLEDQTAVEASPVSIDISANFADADMDTLTFSVDPMQLPESGNIVFDPVTGIFSGTPTVDDARDNAPYVISVSATDNQPGTVPATDQFDLVISALDRANVSLAIAATPDPGMLNDELRWTFTVNNAPGLQAATSVELSGSFVGSELTVTSDSACTIQAPAGQITNFSCTVGGVPPGGSTDVILTTATGGSGDVTTFATAEGTLPVPIDPNIADNSSQLAIGVSEAFSNGAVQMLGATNVLSVAAGDLDGDGFSDLVVGTAAGQPVQIFLNDGFRDFALAPIALMDTAANEGLALADFDGNSTLDLVVANGGGLADMVYSNDGTGNFTAMAVLDGVPNFSADVVAADFNADGFVDIAVAATGANPVFRGDGTGGFTLQGTLGDGNSHSVTVGSLDSEAFDDLVFANVGSASRVWIFDDSGTWFASRALLTIGDAVSVVTGQFGGDGRDDLVFARIPTAIGDVPANPVLINNGDATFAAPASLLGAAPTNEVHVGNVNDVDGAGLDDLVFINASGVHQIWVASNGEFALHSEQIADRDALAGVLTELGMTDVDDPGGVDLAMGGAIQAGVGVFLNDGFGNLGLGDAVAPILTLVGDAAVSVPAGTAYADAGATAEDNIDGDISSSVATAGSVNTSVVGDYTLTYTVIDRAGNEATPITRTVSIAPAAGRGGGGGAISIYFVLILLTGLLLAMQRHVSGRPFCRAASVSKRG